MENRGGEYSVGFAFGDRFDQMIESSRAALGAFNRPLNRIELGRIASAVCEYALGAVAVAPRVDRQHGALAAKLFGADVENVRIVDGGGVEGNFIGSGFFDFLNSSIP